MGPGLNTSLSGFNAASQRLEVAANNIANQQSAVRRHEDGSFTAGSFLPQDVVQVSAEAGGVQTELRTRDNPTTKVYSPDDENADDNGFIEVPNVNTAEELVNAKIATYDARANLNAFRVQSETLKNTLDIIT